MIEPGWLLETHRENDFSQGLQTWSVFKSFGPVNYFKRNRTAGVRRPDDKDGDGAVWYFPIGRVGRVSPESSSKKDSTAPRLPSPTDFSTRTLSTDPK